MLILKMKKKKFSSIPNNIIIRIIIRAVNILKNNKFNNTNNLKANNKISR
jgi:hypothetical protein